jgi:carbon-monoxide dehydrogenase medium subunit
VKRHAEALVEAASQVGDPAVRNRGTIGGNIAHADPASDLPIVLAALGATINIIGNNGKRSVSSSDFFQGVMMTALQDNEVITSIEIPGAPDDQGTAYAKFAHPASRYAVIGVAAAITTNNDTCTSASIAIGGLVPVPLRCSAVEQILIGETLSEETLTTASEAVNGTNGGTDDLGDNLLGDLFASANYRKAIASVYVRRALATAVKRAG